MLVQFGNNWIQKIPLTAKLDSACGLVQFWLSSEFFSSNYFQIGQHVVLLHILIYTSELILCLTICALSATRHNIQLIYLLEYSARLHLHLIPMFVRPKYMCL